MSRALDRIFQRSVSAERDDRNVKITLLNRAPLQRTAPEVALLLGTAAESKHDRQGDFALSKVVADVLTKLGCRPAVVERVVDELKGDAKV